MRVKLSAACFADRVPEADNRRVPFGTCRWLNGEPQLGRRGCASTTETRELHLDGHNVVVPPNEGGRTDLASVPSFMWWLVASYGNHTRAALLHDALVVDTKGVDPPIARTAADRILLSALREPGQKKGGAFRHWLMWAAASVFGTMRSPFWLRPAGLAIHVWIVDLGASIAASPSKDRGHRRGFELPGFEPSRTPF
jgi:hypothetical protein